jgi:hypothetical protein
MMKVTVTPLLSHLPPAVPFDQLDHLADLHHFWSDDSAAAGTVGRRT